ncbi:MAG TPA: poly(3-hydroxyalkanoate) depolymerase [Myxococcaceae bacterium]|nr:poly(3-hydroxyalkanoate) depolymerase [Myxococcaceae bacterium]
MSANREQTQFVVVDGLRLRVSIRGSGRPLLLFNGIGASFEIFDPLRRELRQTETIAVDMPGTGGSETPLLPRPLYGLAGLAARVLDVLGYPQAIDVLGISWGGALAQEFVLRFPRRVRRLVLAATSTGWLSVPGDPRALWVLATPRRYYSPSYFEKVAPTLYGGAVREDPGLLRKQGHLRFIHPPSVRGYLWQLAAGFGWTSLHRLHRVRSPTLVLAADDDPIAPLAGLRLMAKLLPRSRLHVVPKGGHLFLVTHAPEVAPVIESFLGESDGIEPE